MAIIYDFPTPYEEKLKEVELLLEKNYTDQAICALEDWLEVAGSISVDGQKEIQKKLLGCYLLKKEFESCEAIVLQIKQLGCLDLNVAAYDIVANLLQGKRQEADELQKAYREMLKLSSFAYKNLIEFVYQLKVFYEDEWLRDVSKKFIALLEADGFEQVHAILLDLQQVDASYFMEYSETLVQFFQMENSPILKTMLFELLSEKETTLEIIFTDQEKTKKLVTTPESLAPLYELIESSQRDLYALELDEVNTLWCEQQMVLFYQFIFPFFEDIDTNIVLQKFSVVSQGPEIFMDTSANMDTVDKINQYMLSLSLLI